MTEQNVAIFGFEPGVDPTNGWGPYYAIEPENTDYIPQLELKPYPRCEAGTVLFYTRDSAEKAAVAEAKKDGHFHIAVFRNTISAEEANARLKELNAPDIMCHRTEPLTTMSVVVDMKSGKVIYFIETVNS
jgi:hypothetical protein